MADAESGGGGDPNAAATSGGPPPTLASRVKKNSALKLFTAIQAITIIITVLTAVAELVCLIQYKEMTVSGFTLRVFALLLCAVIIMAEVEFTASLRASPIVVNWAAKGVFYIFVGNLVYEMKPVATVTDMQMEFIQGTSVALVVMGLLYFAMGVLCVKRWRDSTRSRYQTMMDHATKTDTIIRESGGRV